MLQGPPTLARYHHGIIGELGGGAAEFRWPEIFSGQPRFEEEPPGDGILRHPEARDAAYRYARSVARWLAGLPTDERSVPGPAGVMATARTRIRAAGSRELVAMLRDFPPLPFETTL